MSKSKNAVELWLKSQPAEVAAELRQFCRDANALGPVQAYLVQQGASCPLPDIQQFVESQQGRMAQEFNEQNKLYAGVSPIGVLDRMILALSNDVDRLEERLAENLRDGDPLYALTIAQAFQARNAAVEKIAKLSSELAKQKSAADRSSYIWGVLARTRQLFMASAPVRDSEHEGWLNEHWSYVLERMEAELS